MHVRRHCTSFPPKKGRQMADGFTALTCSQVVSGSPVEGRTPLIPSEGFRPQGKPFCYIYYLKKLLIVSVHVLWLTCKVLTEICWNKSLRCSPLFGWKKGNITRRKYQESYWEQVIGLYISTEIPTVDKRPVKKENIIQLANQSSSNNNNKGLLILPGAYIKSHNYIPSTSCRSSLLQSLLPPLSLFVSHHTHTHGSTGRKQQTVNHINTTNIKTNIKPNQQRNKQH